MGSHVNYGGVVIALIGFFLTRFTVTLAIYEDPVRFYLAGVVPLALGLGLAAFGVALAVADIDPDFVRTTATWCVIGAGTMLVIAVLTIFASRTAPSTALTIRSQSYLSNFLIGGSVGGTFTGLYAASNRRKRAQLRRQADRLVVLNDMLRHKILNALTSLRGHAMAEDTERSAADTVIEDRSRAIEATVDEVRYFTNRSPDRVASSGPTDLGPAIDRAVETIEDSYPAADVSVGPIPAGLAVRGDDRLERVFVYLLENAVVHAGDDAPAIAVTETADGVVVEISDDGPGLPAAQRRLLEDGAVGDADTLEGGFGLSIVRLFAESYGASIETTVDGGGTTIALTFDRPEGTGGASVATGSTGARPAAPELVVTVLASLVAGVFYAAGSGALGGSVAGIGVFYGIADPLVGWLTHQFHSLVFGFIYVSLVTLVPVGSRDTLVAYVGVALVWAMALWLGASGVIGPIWLQLIGIPATVPNVTAQFFVAHVAWGLSLAACVAGGFRYVAPRLRTVTGRVGRAGLPE